jgi:hypothetical protein
VVGAEGEGPGLGVRYRIDGDDRGGPDQTQQLHGVSVQTAQPPHAYCLGGAYLASGHDRRPGGWIPRRG